MLCYFDCRNYSDVDFSTCDQKLCDPFPWSLVEVEGNCIDTDMMTLKIWMTKNRNKSHLHVFGSHWTMLVVANKNEYFGVGNVAVGGFVADANVGVVVSDVVVTEFGSDLRSEHYWLVDSVDEFQDQTTEIQHCLVVLGHSVM